MEALPHTASHRSLSSGAESFGRTSRHPPGRKTGRRAGTGAPATERSAGGRQKVFGPPPWAIIPTPPTFASPLPGGVGLGYAIEQTRLRGAPRHGQAVSGARRTAPTTYPEDAIVV